MGSTVYFPGTDKIIYLKDREVIEDHIKAVEQDTKELISDKNELDAEHKSLIAELKDIESKFNLKMVDADMNDLYQKLRQLEAELHQGRALHKLREAHAAINELTSNLENHHSIRVSYNAQILAMHTKRLLYLATLYEGIDRMNLKLQQGA